MLALSNFDFDLFKKENWQRKPQVFRQAFVQFRDLLSADELAGIALEPGVDSRIVQNDRGRWLVNHGPFDAYETLGESHWTLLVQAVNEHYPPTRELVQAFRWLPAWRIDDLMVSYATPHGGVGPHLDQYDVFIIQGEGSRRWRVGNPGQYQTKLPHPDLKQIEKFEAIIDEKLEAGDMIYIPAGFPHEGTALTPSLSYSIGFRAPSQAELLSALADYALDQDILTDRYTDSEQTLNAQQSLSAESLPEEAITRIQEQLQEAIHNKEVIRAMAAKLLSTNPRPPLQFWPEKVITQKDLQHVINGPQEWEGVPGLRWIFSSNAGKPFIWIQGQAFAANGETEQLFNLLAEQQSIQSKELWFLIKENQVNQDIFIWLYNEGLIVEVNEEP